MKTFPCTCSRCGASFKPIYEIGELRGPGYYVIDVSVKDFFGKEKKEVHNHVLCPTCTKSLDKWLERK